MDIQCKRQRAFYAFHLVYIEVSDCCHSIFANLLSRLYFQSIMPGLRGQFYCQMTVYDFNAKL